MSAVWAVTTGAYSDYGVRCCFTTKAAAEKHAANLRSEDDGWHRDASVEEFSLLAEAPKRTNIYRRLAVLDLDGNEVARPGVGESINTYWPFGDMWGPAKPVMESRIYSPPIAARQQVWVEVRGTDRERVSKVFSERVAKAKALGLAATAEGE